MSTSKIELATGDILYREGDSNDHAYIVESGELILYSGEQKSRVECERRGAGAIVGELSILTGQPRTVTVEAVTPCVAYRISAQQIEEKFGQVDPVLRACIDTSINFAGRFEQAQSDDSEVPMAPSTVQNIDDLITQIKFELDIVTGVEAGEFSMVYQPILRLSDTGIAGFEALMRWEHPTMGNVPPDQFIAVAEEFGSIGKLTELALSEACKTLRICLATHPSTDFFMSVNVSGKDIDRKGFVDFLAHVLDRYKINPSSLKLEVTETALVPDSEQAERNLKELRRLGCGISIDDFGTGYSNFAYLKSLPLTALKIDRAFAGDVCANSVSRSIVRMLIGLGKELGVDVVAEGMETAEDAAELRMLGCQLAQGYFYHKPMPETDLIHLLSRSADQNVA